MKRIQFSLGNVRVTVKVTAQDTDMSRVRPMNHEMRLAQIEEERRATFTRFI